MWSLAQSPSSGLPPRTPRSNSIVPYSLAVGMSVIPSCEVSSMPLFSVFVLEKLSDDYMREILGRAIKRVTRATKGSLQEAVTDDTETGNPASIRLATDTPSEHEAGGSEVSKQVQPQYRQVTERILKTIISLSLGDARTALSLLELVLSSPTKASESALVASLRRSVSSRYDRSGEDRYDMISALHKSLRGSDGGAALYWLARLVPRFSHSN
jgi:putative ATPase